MSTATARAQSASTAPGGCGADGGPSVFNRYGWYPLRRYKLAFNGTEAAWQMAMPRMTETGKAAIVAAEAQPYGGVKLTPEERARRRLIEEGFLAEDVTPGEFEERLAKAQESAARIAQWRRNLEAFTEQGNRIAARILKRSIAGEEKRLGEFSGRAIPRAFEREQQRELGTVGGPTFPTDVEALPEDLRERARRGAEAITIIQNDNRVNIGTAFLDGVRERPWTPSPEIVENGPGL